MLVVTEGLAAGLVSALVLGLSAAAADNPWPPAPTNLRVTNVTEDSVSVEWGPTVIGDFISSNATSPRRVTVAWVPAEDNSGIDHYTVERDDGTLIGTTTVPSLSVVVGRKVSFLRVCVYATNGLGQDGAKRCGTYTRN
jgi:hypothetical protein